VFQLQHTILSPAGGGAPSGGPGARASGQGPCGEAP